MGNSDNKAEELWQAYTEQGKPITGKGLTLPEAAKGALHGSSHVWVWRKKAGGTELEILLQRRSEQVRTWRGYYDISAAGHIDFSDDPIQTAVRETREEIGLAIEPADLRLLFVNRYRIQDGPSGIIENEFRWVFGYELTAEPAFSYQDIEASSVRWLTIPELEDRLNRKKTDITISPHGEVYFANLIAEIRRCGSQETSRT